MVYCRAMSRTRAAVAALILSCSVGAAAAHAALVPSWQATGPIAFDRYDAAAARLAGDDALLIGGRPSGGNPTASVTRFNAQSGKWFPVGDLSFARNAASAVTLPNGLVLVAGGESEPLQYHNTTEIYDPAKDSWGLGPVMGAKRSAFALQVLADGKVLAVGGWDNLSKSTGAEVLDLQAGKWTPTGDVHDVRADPAVTRLRDGRVLAAGGWTSNVWELDTAEVYSPATNAWTAVAPMHEKRSHAMAATLPDGRVLVAGGSYHAGAPTFLPITRQTYEIYDPATDRWSTPKALNRPRNAAKMVTLSDGRLVIVGGTGPATSDRTAEVYDPATDRWSLTPPMQTGRASHLALAMSDDSVLVTAGFGSGTSSERLVFTEVAEPTPTLTPTPTPTPTFAATPTPDPVPPPKLDPLPVAPKFVLSVPARVTAKRGVLSMNVRCAGPGVCQDRLTLRVRGGRTLARVDVKLEAGKAKAVRLTLSRKERRRLAGKTTKVTITLGTTNRQATMRLR
jgi:N-acetylneuraminic acid mutarotase